MAARTGWHPPPGGTGTSTVVWRTVLGDQPVVVKRLAAPGEGDPAELSDPRHSATPRRAADVVTAGLADTTPGLRSPARTAVEEDAEGITLIQEWVEDAANSGLFVRTRWAGSPARTSATNWLATGQAPTGWTASTDAAAGARWDGPRSPTSPTTCGGVATRSRGGGRAAAGAPARGPAAGASPAGRVTTWWRSTGARSATARWAPTSATTCCRPREEFEPLLDAYLLGLPEGLATPDEAAGRAVTAVYTVLNRAEWALTRVAGEGALAGSTATRRWRRTCGAAAPARRSRPCSEA